MEQLPCETLLQIAMNLNPASYSNLSMTSNAINRCLKHGRYCKEDKDKVCAILTQKKKAIRGRETRAICYSVH